MVLQPTLCLPDDLARIRLPEDRPLRILFLTSVRDTGECDRNGLWVDTGADRCITSVIYGPRYMEGVIEFTARATAPEGALHGLYEIAGVITDDLERDLTDYPVLPTPERRWLWPQELNLPCCNMPSTFRRLPRAALAERAAAKLAFEAAVYERFLTWRADVIVSDHYMARIEYLITEFGLYGKVLNIHPAITIPGHPFCFRGQTPTLDAIAQAKTGVSTMTGATLHLVNSVIDDGPAIAYLVGTSVYATDEPQWLRWRNYQQAKLPLFVNGLRHYYNLVTRISHQ